MYFYQLFKSSIVRLALIYISASDLPSKYRETLNYKSESLIFFCHFSRKSERALNFS